MSIKRLNLQKRRFNNTFNSRINRCKIYIIHAVYASGVNRGDFFKASACVVGTGASILKLERIANRDLEGIAAQTHLRVEKMNQAGRLAE